MALGLMNSEVPPPSKYSLDALAQQRESLLKKLETLAFGGHWARPKEPPDQQPVTTPQRGWCLPPSVTKAPLCIKPEALPRLRLEPPRFDGENAPDWIQKIQKYYNHHYTPLDDRLYLSQYLFDQPASDWREYWVETNRGKGWDDFLLAVEQRFDPEFYKPYAVTASPGLSMGTGWTGRDQRKPNRTTAYPVTIQELDHQSPQRKEEITQEGTRVGDVIINIGVTLDQPGTFLDLISHEIDVSDPVVNSERRDSSIEAEMVVPAVSNERRPQTTIDAQAIATYSSILDAAADTVLDVATKICSMDVIVYDESLESNGVDPSKDEDTTSLFACELVQPTVTFVTNVDIVSCAAIVVANKELVGNISIGRAIPLMRKDCLLGNVVVDGGSNLQGVLVSVLRSGSTRTTQGHETLCFGAMKGVCIFDPGGFESTSTLDDSLMFLFHYPP